MSEIHPNTVKKGHSEPKNDHSNKEEQDMTREPKKDVNYGNASSSSREPNNSGGAVPSSSERDPLIQDEEEEKNDQPDPVTNKSTAVSRICACAYRYQWLLLPFIFLFLYLGIGVAFFMMNGGLKNTTTTTTTTNTTTTSTKTNTTTTTTSTKVTLVDVLYFCVVTLSSVGYGDIIPDTTVSKISTCFYILVGFGLGCILNNMVGHICGALEAGSVRYKDGIILKWILKPWMFDDKKRELSKRTKIYFSVVVIVLLIAIGTLIAHGTEELPWIGSFYLSICSITTVGYGDYSFKTLYGKLWGSLWILVSTVVVARAFTYVSGYDFHRRSDDDMSKLNEITKEELAKEGLVGVVSEYEFARYVLLMKTRKISETEIFEAISKKFNSMEPKDANGNIILDGNNV